MTASLFSNQTPTSQIPGELRADVLVVGAGISGLALAHKLQQLNSEQAVLVTEAQERVGGAITSRRLDSDQEQFLWEEGPNSFSPSPDLLRLAVEVGLRDELVLADRKLPRFVYWQQQLQAVPMSPPALLKTPLLSTSAKLRALAGALGFVNPAMGLQSHQGGEETVAQFFRRHLGQQVLERLVAPFVSGVYAGDPNQLSAGAAFARVAQMEQAGGGLLAGALGSRKGRQAPDPNLPPTRAGELGSFKSGLQALPEAVASHLKDPVRLRWRLNRLTRSGSNYIAQFETPEGPRQVQARAVVLTTPAFVTAEILAELAPVGSQQLREIPYPPVACVVLAYPNSALARPLQGFGHLVPRGQGVRTLGTIWSSSLFPGRAPAGMHILTNFIGGATDPGIAQLSEAEIVQAVHQDLSRVLLKPDAEAPKVLAVHLWQRAIPQYTLGHRQRLAAIEQELKSLPGLQLCANYLDGVALGDCVRRAGQTAESISNYLAVQT
ncbi:protoporphyrinogen oxidase [Leptolyngbya sp. FACHB-261]|uniref:protoporphyrinogen oxidase n=1 Tax=Leptolyngbya sp. FACHB-261 TaxID=2692806 RepID=UPI001689BF79|nr:protoporphyrinogen oxidase [Leptolyngbya sp. FACHB-261]MBD2099841.1 protoporphyrinogen oxidase [Leptolyngbya sp. FACHB-261]